MSNDAMTPVQPFAAFPFPFGLMLPPSAGDAAVVEALEGLTAGQVPAVWPAALNAHRLAYAGHTEAALAAIDDGDEHAAFNRYVLNPDGDDPVEVAAALPEDLSPLVDVLRFANGELDQPPTLTDGIGDVVAALILASQATDARMNGQARVYVELLLEAAGRVERSHPPFAAILRGEAGAAIHDYLGDPPAAAEHLSWATEALRETDLTLSRAEIEYQLGAIAHESAAPGASLQQAMHHYYTTLQLVTREDSPFLWARAQMNLSAAYMSTTMTGVSDSLRLGVAVQALRAALEIFDRDAHPAEWAAATLNLANALVYTPSVKQGDNLVEAVELYEEVLATRDRDADPLGRARVLANQGNALAHLGIFDHAKAKLYEARFLFEEQLDHEGAMAVRSILDEIVKRSVPDGGRDGGGRLAMAGGDGLRDPVAPEAEEG